MQIKQSKDGKLVVVLTDAHGIDLSYATNDAYVMVWVLRCYGGNHQAKKYFRACCRYLEKPID